VKTLSLLIDRLEAGDRIRRGLVDVKHGRTRPFRKAIEALRGRDDTQAASGRRR